MNKAERKEFERINEHTEGTCEWNGLEWNFLRKRGKFQFQQIQVNLLRLANAIVVQVEKVNVICAPHPHQHNMNGSANDVEYRNVRLSWAVNVLQNFWLRYSKQQKQNVHIYIDQSPATNAVVHFFCFVIFGIHCLWRAVRNNAFILLFPWSKQFSQADFWCCWWWWYTLNSTISLKFCNRSRLQCKSVARE